ncbi:(Fe-S)-binding protein [Dyella sp. A6]|uniref:(Fe-S)-binding protein n=1 Tax=Dyella aluminiiresistens TaxID=3069105 RepID=UPI002E7824B4|nr:(Fe-S)-binding protein [Dyella sp. A6]
MNNMPLENTPARIATLADQCVQCGLCLPACPTYALDASEAESPRGRIALAAALARGQVSPTPALREHLDHCLGCMACERVCPAKVDYGELLTATRALLGPSPRRPGRLISLLRHPRALRLLHRLLPPRARDWLRHLLPERSAARTALDLLPTSSPAAVMTSSREPSSASDADTIGLFPGCVASVEDAEAQQAARELLRAAGYRVFVLPAFCCGALDLHGGEVAAAERAAIAVREAWQASGARHLVTITPGCLGTLRRALPGVAVDDPFSLLALRADRLHFRPLSQSVAIHMPCTQVNVARNDEALMQLLRRIPDLDLARVGGPPYCCGAAGSHVLEFPERADILRDALLDRVSALAPERLLSSNIGCRLHLAAGMRVRGDHWPLQHPLTLLARQLESTGKNTP